MTPPSFPSVRLPLRCRGAWTGAFALATLALLGPGPLDSQVPTTADLVPGTAYDPSIPSLVDVAGHDFTEEVTPPELVVAYLRSLAEAAPDRTRLLEYGETWEGRPLMMLLLGSPERLSRLDEIRAGLQRLSDPRDLTDAEAAALVAELPVVSALVHGVHGNEISSSGAAMAQAYHLLAARNDPMVDGILEHSLVLIDAMQNPDGRARFVFQNSMGRARWPDEEPASAEHDEPWPGGRTNHYLFDLNRDWFAQTQPESRGRVALLLEWMPHVVMDLHEMGGNSTYYFPPNAVPGNPWSTDAQNALLEIFGMENAAAFDDRGFSYFNRDTYDSFYPGYGASWPQTQGAIGGTFEQASARGLVFRKADGDLLTYGQGVLQHFTAALRTLDTAARNRARILETYLEFRRSGIRLGQGEAREVILHSAHDPAMASRLAETLVLNGIEVGRATEPVRVAGRSLPAEGTFVVPLDQPAHRLIRNLLDPHTPMDTAFVERQIERRAQRQRDQIYDVTAWSLPLLWDVERIVAARPTGAAVAAVEAPRALVENATSATSSVAALTQATVGYLIPWGTGTAALVAEALREGIRVRTAGGDFELDGQRYPLGTAIVRTAENRDDLASRLAALAARHGVSPVAVDRSYIRDGTSLGSGTSRALREPKVLLIYDEPGSAYSVGWSRYVLERRYGQRTTAVRTSSFGRVDLHEYDVVVLPSGDYRGAIGGGQVDRLRDWMRAGGTLVTMAESSRWAARPDVGLLATSTERRGGRAEGEPASSRPAYEQPIDYLEAIAPDDEAPEQTPGAIVRTVLDMSHWLSAGTDGEIGVLVDGTRVFTPLQLDAGTNVGRYAGVDDMVLGGIVWDDARPQLAHKAFLMHQPVGQGQLIAFAEDPNYRAYAEATELLFINAVLLGPGR